MLVVAGVGDVAVGTAAVTAAPLGLLAGVIPASCLNNLCYWPMISAQEARGLLPSNWASS